MTNREGFYRVPWSAHGLIFQKCPQPEACPQVPRSVRNATLVSYDQHSFSELQCAVGHTGPLCEKCKVGYGRLGTAACEECGDPGKSIGVLFAISFLIGVVVLWVIRGQINSRGLGRKAHSVVKKVLLNHIQQVALMLAFELDWPSPFSFVLSITDSATSVGSQLASPECVRTSEVPNSASSAFRLTLIVTLFAPVLLSLIASCVSVTLFFMKRLGLPELRRHVIVATGMCAFIFYTPIVRVVMQLFACSDVGGQQRVLNDREVLCDSPGNNAWRLGLGLPVLLLYVFGLPAGLYWIMRKHRDELDDNTVRRTYGFFFLGYRKEFYWYEVVIMVRKALFAMLLVALQSSGLLWQISAAGVILSLALALSTWIKPFEKPLFNLLDLGSVLLSLITIFGGAVLLQFDSALVSSSVEEAAGGKLAQQAVSVLLTISNGGFLLFLLYRWAQSFVAKEVRPALKQAMTKKTPTRSLVVDSLGEKVSSGGTADSKAKPSLVEVDTAGRFVTKNPLSSRRSLARGSIVHDLDLAPPTGLERVKLSRPSVQGMLMTRSPVRQARISSLSSKPTTRAARQDTGKTLHTDEADTPSSMSSMIMAQNPISKRT